MVYGSMGHFLRKFKRKKGIDGVAEDGYVPPKPAYLWQRRRRQEERMDNEKKEQVTQIKINPWFQLCSSLQNQTAMALFSFPGDVQAGELEAWEGDPLTIESVDRTEVWWQAVNMRTGKSGFIPWNYITEETGVKDVVDAWHEIDRRESEIKLTMPDLPNGTYILRPNPLRIALSVLCIVGSAKIIKHFSVRYDNSLSGYFITPGKRFTQLKDLTDYYKVSHGGNVPLLSSSMPHSPPPIQSRNLRIPLEKLEMKTHIARGGRFGSVYRAVCTTSGKRSVVVKKISGHMGRGAVVARAEACHKLHNRAIVQFIGLCEAPKSGLMLLVWEYMPGGNLRDFLIKNKTTADYIRLQHWLHQAMQCYRFIEYAFFNFEKILDGMDYLEGVEAFHGELTASNVFLSFELCAKIGNFGFNGRFSKFISDAFDQHIGQMSTGETKSPQVETKVMPWEIMSFRKRERQHKDMVVKSAFRGAKFVPTTSPFFIVFVVPLGRHLIVNIGLKLLSLPIGWTIDVIMGTLNELNTAAVPVSLMSTSISSLADETKRIGSILNREMSELPEKLIFHEPNPGKNDFSNNLAETQAVRWAAPESLDSSHVFDIRCDIWSFGVVMFEVFTLGSTPYKDMDVEEVVERVKAGYRLPNPTSLGFYCEEVMYETMKNCWNTDSTDRPTFHELWFVFEDHLAKDGDVYAEIE
ncbi:Tyrosine-protein kinase SPK-1 [Echinococcus granulosus]|uniref:Tyrosine-protein kinase n=1 Tax=Echinococcus granulosus TaxID=6210 RepID=W6UGX4_ECHGR|nr:Tyrosine-protein kinase SPK-1 [Echinococcus granulosus]EUB60790.1 Tyrosine-protein kinase SPK-1 [Echinococcus granulosus]